MEFDPQLPENKQKAISALGYGLLNKASTVGVMFSCFLFFFGGGGEESF